MEKCPSGIVDTELQPSMRERLTRKACEQYIVIRNIGWVDFGYITKRHLPVVHFVCFLCFGIKLGGEYTRPTILLEAKPHTAYTGEKIDKLELVIDVRFQGIFSINFVVEMFPV